MSNVKVEEKWWLDSRRAQLTHLLGDARCADGAAIRLWATAFWHAEHQGSLSINEDRIFDKEIFEKCCLIVRLDPKHFYIRGSLELYGDSLDHESRCALEADLEEIDGR